MCILHPPNAWNAHPMSNPVLFPPPAKFGPFVARRLMDRWHIRLTALSQRAGVSETRIKRWFWQKFPTAKFAEHGAVYDAMFGLAVEKAAWQAKAIAEEYEAFQARRAKAIEAGKGT